MLRLLARLIPFEGHGKVVPQGIHNNHNRFIEALWMPAARLRIARYEATLHFDWRHRAFGSIGQDEAGEEEAGTEEVDAYCMEDAETAVSGRAKVLRRLGRTILE